MLKILLMNVAIESAHYEYEISVYKRQAMVENMGKEISKVKHYNRMRCVHFQTMAKHSQ